MLTIISNTASCCPQSVEIIEVPLYSMCLCVQSNSVNKYLVSEYSWLVSTPG